VGIFNFDGVKAVTGYVTNIDNGRLNVQTISSGTYTVSANAHGSVTASFTSLNGNGTWQIAFVLNSVSASVAHSLQSILINTGAGDPRVYAITANSINLTVPATAAKLKGTYSVLLNWWVTGVQQVAVGTIVFDGKSKVTCSFTYQVAEGTATTVTGTGTYSVNSDGSGSMNSLALSNGETLGFDFVMNTATGTSVAKGIQLLEVNSDSLAVATGNAVYE
jgi:hypothetical protein